MMDGTIHNMRAKQEQLLKKVEKYFLFLGLIGSTPGQKHDGQGMKVL